MRYILVSLFLLILPAVFAQDFIDGEVFSKLDGKPLSNATVRLVKRNTAYSTNANGHFQLRAPASQLPDTLVVSSIGFQTLKVPVNSPATHAIYYMQVEEKQLDNITVKAYMHQGSQGTYTDKAGYFRSWFTNRTGGEIGKIMHINSKEYLVEKVRVRVNNQCDTCVLKLHIRTIRNGFPDFEILQDSVAVTSHKVSFADRAIDFDLRPYNVIIRNNKDIFVGFETLHSSMKDGSSCSLSFIGEEKDSHVYKRSLASPWLETYDYSIYMQVFFRY